MNSGFPFRHGSISDGYRYSNQIEENHQRNNQQNHHHHHHEQQQQQHRRNSTATNHIPVVNHNQGVINNDGDDGDGDDQDEDQQQNPFKKPSIVVNTNKPFDSSNNHTFANLTRENEEIKPEERRSLLYFLFVTTSYY